MEQKSEAEKERDQRLKYEDRKTLLRHIDKLIKFDVGEKVFYFDGWNENTEIPRVGTIEGIHVTYSYDDNKSEPYDIEYILKQREGENISVFGRRKSQKYCRKYDEKIENFVNEYHDFFDRMKKSE